MLVSNTMRFATDVFGFEEEEEQEEKDAQTVQEDGTISEESATAAPFTKRAMIVAKKAWDFTNKSAVTAIAVTGSCPEGCSRRVMFKIDDKYWYYSGGVLVEFTDELTAQNVLKKGNKGLTIGAMTQFPGLAGKKVYPVVALSAKSTAEDMPTIKLSAKATVTAETLTETKESVVYELTTSQDLPTINSIVPDITLKGDASLTLKVRLRDADGIWTDWLTLAKAVDKQAQALQFKGTFKVTRTDGTDEAILKSVTVEHTMGESIVSGTDANLFSVIADYENDLKTCYVVVRHEPLIDAKIEAYVNFMNAPSRREMIELGAGTGAAKVYTLGVNNVADEMVTASSIELYADGEPVTDFSYNSETSSVKTTVKSGSMLYATYEYNHGTETWRKMAVTSTEPYFGESGTYMTRFSYSLDDTLVAGKTVSNVRLTMKRLSGTFTENLGKANGKKQMFVLKHLPKVSTIAFTNTVDWEYDDDSNILTLTAKKNTVLSVSYKYYGKKIVLRSFSAGWTCD